MIDKSILGQLKQTNIGKDKEKTKERLKEIWKNLDMSKRAEITDYSGLTKYTFERSYKEGNISAKLVVAVAEVLQINPFYLTGEEDDKDSYSEEKVREFLISKNYGDLVGRTVKQKRRSAGKKTDDKKTDDAVSGTDKETAEIAPTSETVQKEESEEAEPTPDEKLEPGPDEKLELMPDEKLEIMTDEKLETTPEPEQATDTLTACFGTLLARIQEKAQNITNEKKDLLCNMPENEVQSLISSLHLRAKYNEEAELIVALTNLILTSM